MKEDRHGEEWGASGSIWEDCDVVSERYTEKVGQG